MGAFCVLSELCILYVVSAASSLSSVFSFFLFFFLRRFRIGYCPWCSFRIHCSVLCIVFFAVSILFSRCFPVSFFSESSHLGFFVFLRLAVLWLLCLLRFHVCLLWFSSPFLSRVLIILASACAACFFIILLTFSTFSASAIRSVVSECSDSLS